MDVATVRLGDLATVDSPDAPDLLTLPTEDRVGGLASRLNATRTISELSASCQNTRQLAGAVRDMHQPGTRTLVVLNTVRRAVEVFDQLRRGREQHDPPFHLLHSRFRTHDRERIVVDTLDAPVDPDGSGQVLVATHVVEAGADLSAATLVTDAAPWPSIVQRAGRCNRAGEDVDARRLWDKPPKPEPYDASDIEATTEQPRKLEAQAVTSTELRELGRTGHADFAGNGLRHGGGLWGAWGRHPSARLTGGGSGARDWTDARQAIRDPSAQVMGRLHSGDVVGGRVEARDGYRPSG